MNNNPKHIFGSDISSAKTAAEAMEMANLNWTVEAKPTFTKVGDTMVEIPKHMAIVRMDNNKVLGTVGGRYVPVQNAPMFEIAGELMAMGGQFVKAGVLEGGSRFWAQVKLPNSLVIGKNDEVERFLTFMNSHDGSTGIKALITPTRMFCSNQLRSIIGKTKDFVSIRHTVNASSKLAEAQKVMLKADQYYQQFKQLADNMFNTRYSVEQMQALAEYIFPLKANENVVEGEIIEVATRTQDNRNSLIDLMDNGMGHKETGIAGTAWGAYMAATEFVDHHRGTRLAADAEIDADEARTVSAWFGQGAIVKQNALDFIQAQIG
jgi:phage/plasmid-like protein (TIGR03299 family)